MMIFKRCIIGIVLSLYALSTTPVHTYSWLTRIEKTIFGRKNINCNPVSREFEQLCRSVLHEANVEDADAVFITREDPNPYCSAFVAAGRRLGVVESCVKNLPLEEQRFILGHEAGHLALHHVLKGEIFFFILILLLIPIQKVTIALLQDILYPYLLNKIESMIKSTHTSSHNQDKSTHIKSLKQNIIMWFTTQLQTIKPEQFEYFKATHAQKIKYWLIPLLSIPTFIITSRLIQRAFWWWQELEANHYSIQKLDCVKGALAFLHGCQCSRNEHYKNLGFFKYLYKWIQEKSSHPPLSWEIAAIKIMNLTIR